MAMENTKIPVTCSRCGEKKPIGEMRLDKTGKNLVCNDCLENPVRAHLKSQSKKVTEKMPSNINHGPRKTFVCQSCGFVFERKKIKPTRCPYCASNDLVEKEEIKVDKLLELKDD